MIILHFSAIAEKTFKATYPKIEHLRMTTEQQRLLMDPIDLDLMRAKVKNRQLKHKLGQVSQNRKKIACKRGNGKFLCKLVKHERGKENRVKMGEMSGEIR